MNRTTMEYMAADVVQMKETRAKLEKEMEDQTKPHIIMERLGKQIGALSIVIDDYEAMIKKAQIDASQATKTTA